ncbi:hypothetical protein [Streptomyces sp. NPDC090025]|uniref:hypothetical protein n=1 Tax=Streptomyces sp. NPDC090025 TaxID=3365922 RepID=UPI003837B0B4
MSRRISAQRAAVCDAARADKDVIIFRVQAGERIAQIADDYGVSDTWLRARLDEWRVPRRPRRRLRSGYVFRGRARRSPEELAAARARFVQRRDEVSTRYASGAVSANALGREFGISDRWIAAQLHEWGVPVRNWGEAVDILRRRAHSR